MIVETAVFFPSPVTLRLSAAGAPGDPVMGSFKSLPLHVQADTAARELRAYLPPISNPLTLYGIGDFSDACGDTMEQHAARVLQLLGFDPASVLQALLDGGDIPAVPPRVPREIANWRAKAILSGMGKLAMVDALIAALPEPQATVLGLAWHGNAALARASSTVAALAGSLGFSVADTDAFFIAAAALDL